MTLTTEQRDYDRYVTVGRFERESHAVETGITYGLLSTYLQYEKWDYWHGSDGLEEVFENYIDEGIGLRDDYTAEDLFVMAGEADAHSCNLTWNH